jgi:hypothetical protein
VIIVSNTVWFVAFAQAMFFIGVVPKLYGIAMLAVKEQG